MPLDGLRYAKGTARLEHGIPSSAFSRGDILMLTSTSSLSRVNPYAIAAGAEVEGIALSDSIDSIDNKVAYIVPGPDCEFWVPTNAGSTLTKGASSGVSFVVGTQRYYAESGGTAVVVITAGVADCDQSTTSKVRARILSSGGLVNSI